MKRIQIRHILYFVLMCRSLTASTKQHTLERGAKGSEIYSEPPRLSQKSGYGTVAEVEPHPDIRIYVYNPKNAFNPTNEMFSNRTLRELKNQRFKNQSQAIQNEFERIKASEVS
ncbi:conserved hypothetical protein [Theileria orientalis strain Shintoku]|uniref:Uncharacterized protein n=1 Tax=Theileria orientalis strain Shintoku TaxID=869250 RepID=J4DPJ8_THEOR|nr:conserved hypothetical protein [Theileria orientalis strain Shintoku]PVC49954.1 hypothetical protein MACL_00002645 [Theileria orientalis]BAM40829.1 conserved hypothetical protein [Theileria orientalis strain Shintoku]|eukprot:XP_009691130.1 conserved hypothetical protein [Theileria orientalis strain Shintoku]